MKDSTPQTAEWSPLQEHAPLSRAAPSAAYSGPRSASAARKTAAESSDEASPQPVAARPRLLFVEDNEDDALLVLRRLRKDGMDVDSSRVETLSAFERALGEYSWDIVLCDYALPACSPKLILDYCRERHVTVPVVVVSGHSDERVGVDAMRLGATDYLSKDNLKRLSAVVRREVEQGRRQRRQQAERKLFEVRLHQAHKMESIGLLAAGVAHEINTPMQFIGDNLSFLQQAFEKLGSVLDCCQALSDGQTATAEALAEQLDWDAVKFMRQQVPGALEMATEGVRRVAQIVSAMQSYSHPGGGVARRTDIETLIKTAITLSRNEWKPCADVELTEASDVGDFLCFPDELGQVLLNLIVNAAHAIEAAAKPGRGLIKVSARARPLGAEIRVSDTGTGIPRDIQARMFDPFFTTKKQGKGTGQGLALAYNTIVNQHGGDILVESEPGQGSTIILHLPELEPRQSKAVDEPTSPGKDGSRT